MSELLQLDARLGSMVHTAPGAVLEGQALEGTMQELFVDENGTFGFLPFCTADFKVYYREGNDVKRLGPLMKPADIRVLTELCQELPQGCRIVEVGAFVGHATCLLASIAAFKHGTLTTIDSFEYFPHIPIKSLLRKNLADRGLRARICHCTSDAFDMEQEAYDLAFIDGDHRYSQVSRDIRRFYQMVRPGGILCGHDLDGTTYEDQHAEEDYVNGVHHGVGKALALCGHHVQKMGDESSVWFIRRTR